MIKHRPYKLDSPENTVNKIKQILHDANIFIEKKSCLNPINEVFSVRIEMKLKDGGFGANGKGVTYEYAMASAYAEFMERLQNGFFADKLPQCFYNKLKAETNIYIAPDEQKQNIDQILSLPTDILTDLNGNNNLSIKDFWKFYYSSLNSNGYNDCICIPFTNLTTEKTILIPCNLLHMSTGSNGMCAGNTKSESIFQGLCELMERYAGYVVMFNDLSPPTIPEHYIKSISNQAYNIISDIKEKYGYDVIIKDFSANIRLPVLGAIILDNKKQKYRLNIGSSTVFIEALNRVLTEILQGVANQEELNEVMLPIPKSFSLLDKHEEISKFHIDGRGQFPASLFRKESSYSFDESIFHNPIPFQDEVLYIRHIFSQINLDIYVRDTSFLGFPSHHVYIPLISTGNLITPKENKYQSIIEYDLFINKIYNISKLNHQELVDVANFLEKLSVDAKNTSLAEILRLEFRKKAAFINMPIPILAALIWLAVENFSKALENLLLIKETLNNQFFLCLADYIQDLIGNKKHLVAFYPEEIIESVKNMILQHKDILNHISMPSCPDCHKCSFTKECITKNKVRILLTLNKKFKANA